jgi:hypothetical protein
MMPGNPAWSQEQCCSAASTQLTMLLLPGFVPACCYHTVANPAAVAWVLSLPELKGLLLTIAHHCFSCCCDESLLSLLLKGAFRAPNLAKELQRMCIHTTTATSQCQVW